MWRRNVCLPPDVLGYQHELPAAAQRTKIVAKTAVANEQLPAFEAAIENAASERAAGEYANRLDAKYYAVQDEGCEE